MPGELTAKQRRILRGMRGLLAQAPGAPPQPLSWLSYDIAQHAEVDNLSAGAVLLSLERRGLVDRCVDEDGTSRWWLT